MTQETQFRVRKGGPYVGIVETIDGKSIVCTVTVPYNDDLQSHRVTKQRANLIAAAPDMLAALQNALPWLIKAHNDGAFDGCALPLGGKKAYEQIERAIAKAVQP